MDIPFVEAVVKNGLGAGMAVTIAFMFYKVLMHILRQQESIMQMATMQNEKWQKSLDEHTSQARQFHEQVAEAHKYQREEHIKMLEFLNTICTRTHGAKD